VTTILLPGDRHPDDAELLHGFGVLAKCSIESVDDRNRLFIALEEGQADARRNPGLPIAGRARTPDARGRSSR
jgi:hypothetical protein